MNSTDSKTGLMGRPKSGEYSSYYEDYIDLVKGKDILSELERQLKNTIPFLEQLPVEKWDYAYAEGKWTIKEIMVHLIDTERVFGYRALRLSRGDQVEMPGFDQDLYAGNSKASSRTPESIISEYQLLRSSTLGLLKHLDHEQYTFIGKANNTPLSARAVAWIIAGHQEHHMDVIKERYL